MKAVTPLLLSDNAMYEDTPVRANSALANYLNNTTTDNLGDYEVPISTKSTKSSASTTPRAPAESMYVAMDGVESIQKEQKLNGDFVDSFEYSQDGSERYEVHKVSVQK